MSLINIGKCVIHIKTSYKMNLKITFFLKKKWTIRFIGLVKYQLKKMQQKVIRG